MQGSVSQMSSNILWGEAMNYELMRGFVNKYQWTFAKTYAQKAPHEYLVLDRIKDEWDRDMFVGVAQFINDAGFTAYYYSRQGRYYILDDYYYWTMDEVISETDLINRAKLADYSLINRQWFWNK
jgi:hypothetical protein